jgi:hypothetical protein
MYSVRLPTIAITALVIGVGLVVATLTTRTQQCHARSYFDVDTNATNRWPDFLGADANALRLLLDSREGRRLLAEGIGVAEGDFVLRKIGPVRGTGLGCIEYSGVNSNSVKGVASKAATIVVRYYATNQPGWRVTYIDSECFTPPSSGERLKRCLGF